MSSPWSCLRNLDAQKSSVVELTCGREANRPPESSKSHCIEAARTNLFGRSDELKPSLGTDTSQGSRALDFLPTSRTVLLARSRRQSYTGQRASLRGISQTR